MQIDDTFQLGYILKPHGLHGQVTAHFDVDDASAYKKIKALYLASLTAPEQLLTHEVETVQFQPGGRILLKLKGVDTIEAADLLRSHTLYLPLANLPRLRDDQFYYHDVIGFTVVDAELGELGTVENFYELPRQDVLAMRYQEQEVLIPVANELITRADMAARQVFVNLPDGLLDVYLTPDDAPEKKPKARKPRKTKNARAKEAGATDAPTE